MSDQYLPPEEPFENPPQRRSPRVPPHNIAAEESVLGAMLLTKEAIADAIEILNADDFYKPANQKIFNAITALFATGEPADIVTVADELGRAGMLDGITCTTASAHTSRR